MESFYTTKKENHRRLHSFPPPRFQKFQMKLGNTGVHILIPPNSLTKHNHSARVQNGVLHLRIKKPKNNCAYYSRPMLYNGREKDIDFQIRLPDKGRRHINNVRFYNGAIKIRLSKEHNKTKGFTRWPGPSFSSHRSTVN
ncbi:hypothetical protein SAMN04488513_101875 [Pseudozobellia thermophila]|uniref:Uncharacterized protein n=1 Tax=Pseudozobellia thermophila TaxID=192903 RepID=A0A1M6CUQ0_9FLAO|nr:hypothetical protein SAMN04488513_101875 [Pseudozobellia thermophila]